NSRFAIRNSKFTAAEYNDCFACRILKEGWFLPQPMGELNRTEAEAAAAERPHVILSRRRRWVVTAGILLGMFLAALEATVVGTAMPTIIASLGGLDRYSWVFSAFLLASTVTVPVWGRLSDLYGRRALYLIGVSLFLLGSALSGASQTITQL